MFEQNRQLNPKLLSYYKWLNDSFLPNLLKIQTPEDKPEFTRRKQIYTSHRRIINGKSILNYSSKLQLT